MQLFNSLTATAISQTRQFNISTHKSARWTGGLTSAEPQRCVSSGTQRSGQHSGRLSRAAATRCLSDARASVMRHAYEYCTSSVNANITLYTTCSSSPHSLCVHISLFVFCSFLHLTSFFYLCYKSIKKSYIYSIFSSSAPSSLCVCHSVTCLLHEHQSLDKMMKHIL